MCGWNLIHPANLISSWVSQLFLPAYNLGTTGDKFVSANVKICTCHKKVKGL